MGRSSKFEIRFKGGKPDAKGSLMLVAMLGSFFAFQAIMATSNPKTLDIYGITSGYKIQLFGRGIMVRNAHTPKTKTYRARPFFSFAGREIDLKRDVDVNSGSVTVALSRYRWLGLSETVEYDSIGSSTNGSYRLKLPETGWYRLRVHLSSFKGRVRLRWL